MAVAWLTSYDYHNGKCVHLTVLSCRSCAVCQDDYESEQLVRRLPCLHTFHVLCIDQWLQRNSKCPVCMKDIKELNISPS